MRRFVVAAAIPTLAVWACSSFDAGGGGSEPLPDAGIDRAIADGTAQDTASPNDPLASITYDRKDDFERDPLTGGPLAWTAEAPNTTVESVIGVGACDDAHCTPSRSVTITHDDTGAGYLATTLAPSTRNLRFDFAMKISRVNSEGGRVRVVSIELTDSHVIFVQVEGDQLQLGDKIAGEESLATVDLGPIAFDAWSRYRLYVNLDERMAALAHDGAAYPTTLHLRPETVTTMVRARLGITLVTENFFQLLYDDVGLRELPKP